MKKGVKGQVSVFVIVAILVIVVVIGIYFLKIRTESKLDKEFFAQEEIKVQVDNIYANVLLCIDIVGRKGLEVIGFGGGYYNKPAESFEIEDGFVPYYYDKGDFLMPSRENIESELEDYFEDNLGDCFDGLRFEGFEIEYKELDNEIIIDKEKVIFQVDSSIVVKKNGRKITYETKKDVVSVDSALSDILEVAEYITESHERDSKMYCISCVGEMAEERDVYVENVKISENLIYVIIGENRTSDDVYLFSFLNRYTGEEISDDFLLTGNIAEELPRSFEDV